MAPAVEGHRSRLGTHATPQLLGPGAHPVSYLKVGTRFPRVSICCSDPCHRPNCDGGGPIAVSKVRREGSSALRRCEPIPRIGSNKSKVVLLVFICIGMCAKSHALSANSGQSRSWTRWCGSKAANVFSRVSIWFLARTTWCFFCDFYLARICKSFFCRSRLHAKPVSESKKGSSHF